jgi:hypothetical protein
VDASSDGENEARLPLRSFKPIKLKTFSTGSNSGLRSKTTKLTTTVAGRRETSCREGLWIDSLETQDSRCASSLMAASCRQTHQFPGGGGSSSTTEDGTFRNSMRVSTVRRGSDRSRLDVFHASNCLCKALRSGSARGYSHLSAT